MQATVTGADLGARWDVARSVAASAAHRANAAGCLAGLREAAT